MNFPSTPPEPRWVAELDRRLQELPDRRAPDSLAPRVMAALRARAARPWYRRTWWQWPAAAQVLSLLVFSGLLGGLTWAGLHVGRGDLAATLGTGLTELLALLAPVWGIAATLMEAMGLVLRQVPWLVWGGILAFFAAMYLSCIGLGTALYQIALPRRNP